MQFKITVRLGIEEEKLVALYRKKGRITLIKATYEGLNQAQPHE